MKGKEIMIKTKEKKGKIGRFFSDHEKITDKVI